MPHELPIPPVASSDPKAREIARIWMASGGQHVALASGLWEDPASWGIMLVDLANHVANAYELTAGRHRSAVLARIREGFDAERESSTDEPQAGMLDEAADALPRAAVDAVHGPRFPCSRSSLVRGRVR